MIQTQQIQPSLLKEKCDIEDLTNDYFVANKAFDELYSDIQKQLGINENSIISLAINRLLELKELQNVNLIRVYNNGFSIDSLYRRKFK